MRAQITAQPFFLLMMGISALAMFVPATHASILNAHAEARAFFYSGLLLLIFTVMVAIARNSG
ncbi:MAG: TrkH family potassium uptake protein, partial [Lutimaribacter sp.]